MTDARASRWRASPQRLARLVAGLWLFGPGEGLVVHGDLVVASPDAGSCETVVRERLIERNRLFRVFVECKRKNEASL